MTQELRKRLIAIKASVAQLLEGRFCKEEGWTPSYLLLRDGRKVYRVNILGFVVGCADDDFVLIVDDGSGRIAVRSFNSRFEFRPGTLLNIIGRPRQYGDEIYIVPEIIKAVENILWLKVREAELRRAASSEHVVIEEERIDIRAEEESEVIDMIKMLDDGDGVLLDNVLKSVDETIIEKLLKEGKIYKIGPDRIKVLETKKEEE